MIKWPVLIGVVGILGSGFAAVLIGRWASNPPPGGFWLCGLAGLAPAWLINLLALLGELPDRGPETPLPPSLILSTSAALLGVIVAYWAVRYLQGRRPVCHMMTYWLLGVVAFAPAWAISLWFLL